MKYGLLMLGIMLTVGGAYLFSTLTSVPSAIEGAEAGRAYHLQAVAPRQIGLAMMTGGVIIILISFFLRSRVQKIPNAPYDTYRNRLGEKRKKKSA